MVRYMKTSQRKERSSSTPIRVAPEMLYAIRGVQVSMGGASSVEASRYIARSMLYDKTLVGIVNRLLPKKG